MAVQKDLNESDDGEPRGVRARLRRVLESLRFEQFITGLIVLNAVTLGLETSKWASTNFGEQLHLLDKVILAIFVAELVTRMFAYGGKFWRDPWSLFDFAVVGIALVPATENLSVLRAMRILRVLRLVSTVKSMRRVVTGLLAAIPSMGSVVMLLLLIYYVFSVMATKLYGETFPKFFGTIGESAYSLFQIMTLESWSEGIVRPVMEVHPWAWVFFVPFILITSFAVLNLFIGIIVDAMQSQHSETRDVVHEMTTHDFEMLMTELKGLREEVRDLRGDRGSPPRGSQ